MKSVITRAEYLQLLGLKVLADMYSQKLSDICIAMNEVLVTADDGHVGDVVYQDTCSVDWALNAMGIAVEDKP